MKRSARVLPSLTQGGYSDLNNNEKKGITLAATVLYEVGDGLYLNITNKCTNRCDFCIRNNGDGAYGSDSLWLKREPTYEEIVSELKKRDISSYSELVFCGYGEPTCRLDTLLAVARYLRLEYPDKRIRLNTNGHASLIAGYDTASRFEGLFDTVSISLNAPLPDEYEAICHSVFGAEAFGGMLDFARRVSAYVPECIFSVVGDFLTEHQLSECKRIADECGVALKVRKYIGK